MSNRILFPTGNAIVQNETNLPKMSIPQIQINGLYIENFQWHAKNNTKTQSPRLFFLRLF